MDYKEKVTALLNSQEMSNEQKEKLESIFPELKESEDERIRKELIGFLKSPFVNENITDEKVNPWISWLEEQGKQKSIMNIPAREVIFSIWSLGNKWKELTNGSISTVYGTQLDYIQKHWHESEYYLRAKQGELNPALSEANLPEFESYLCLMFQKFRTKGMCTNGEIIDYVKEHSQKLKDILVKPAWSEEDESMRIRTLGILGKCYMGELPTNVEEELNWLKSLKDRVQPQPKQEWSKEDEEHVKSILSAIKCFEAENYDRQDVAELYRSDMDWLKSLKDRCLPQPKQEWSEEDIKRIDCLIAIVECRGYADHVEWLESLKNRVQPQPKQEWSEEDKKMVGNIRSIIEKYAFSQSAVDVNGELCEKEYIEADNWLKSLRPQNTWKPSEEMLEALYRAIPEDAMAISEDEMLLDKLYQGLKYGRVLSKK